MVQCSALSHLRLGNPLLRGICVKKRQNGGKNVTFSEGRDPDRETKESRDLTEISSNSILSFFQFFGYFLNILRGKLLFKGGILQEGTKNPPAPFLVREAHQTPRT